MAVDWEQTSVRFKEDPVLRSWAVEAERDPETTAIDLAHAILFGRAQAALEAVAAGGLWLTADHARALHFANEMAELRHYGPLIAVDGGLPVLAPGVREVIGTFDGLLLWHDQPPWQL
ncbi:hypothetical protein [Arthrobacter sp. L77]|uniref:hypothetical protein n=1 Tax=Arthrobacter sp. L77 TaxID=1496689 RepID=UPI0005BC34F5|nr:hypothetical protein [Arthrobacter sp. L77]